jgi:F-type H+-transporting ATPase subunit epsilon
MADELQVDIVAPSDRVFEGRATGVRAPGVEGSFEVLNNHAPMIAAFEVGPLFVRTSDETITFATSGGFLEVIDNVVTVLAETVEPASEIDVDRAREAEERALKRLREGSDAVDQERAQEALERARNRLRVGMGEVARK